MQEYTLFYGFSEDPFKVIPDPWFFFLSESNREALACIIHGINERKGFILISGEEGIGKTSLIQYSSNKLDGIASALIIDHPSITIERILEQIFLKLNLAPTSQEKGSLIRQLNAHLIQGFARGENLVIFIDDAHKLNKELAEDLRLLSNLETTRSKLLQIVLVGPPEIDTTLDSKDLKAFKQRITIRGKISRLTEEESRDYIDHHLKAVGSGGLEVLTPGAVSLICRRAKGVPRSINLICRHAFSVGHQRSTKRIDSSIVREVIKKRRIRKQWLPGTWAFGEKFLFRKLAYIVSQGFNSVYTQKHIASGVWAFWKEFLFTKFPSFVKRVSDHTYTQKQKLSGAWASGQKSLSSKISYVVGQAVNSVYTQKHRLSGLWASGQKSLSSKISYIVGQGVNSVYTQKHRLSGLWASGQKSLSSQLSYIVNHAVNNAHTQKHRLSSAWAFGKEFLFTKFPSFVKRVSNSTYAQKQKLSGAWSSGQKLLSRKISYSALAAICLLIGIFLFNEHIKSIPGKTGITSLTENLIVAEKIAPPVIERGIDVSPEESPLQPPEKIEPKPLTKQLNVVSKSPGHVPPRGKKVSTKNLQAQVLGKTGTTPNDVRAIAASTEIRQIESASMDSPSVVPDPVPFGQFVAGASGKPKEPEIKKLGQEVPVIVNSFASKEIKPGDIWKVYLKASDPNGDMKYIVGVIEKGGSHLNVIKLEEKNRHHFSGYIYLNTIGTNAWLNRINLTLTIWIKDSDGHLSQPVVFPLSFQTNVLPEKHPQDLFEEQDLGPIMTQLLQTLDNLGG